MAAGFGCPCDRDLAFGIKRFLRAQRAENDGTIESCTKQLEAGIDLADVNHTSCVQLVARIRFAVGSKGVLTIHAGSQEAPVSGRNISACDRLEIEDVQRIAAAGYHAVDILQRRSLSGRPREVWKAGIQRTGSQIFYESAPSIHYDSPWRPTLREDLIRCSDLFFAQILGNRSIAGSGARQRYISVGASQIGSVTPQTGLLHARKPGKYVQRDVLA